MSKIRSDDRSIYLITNGTIYRPGPIIGFDHAYEMGDGDLKEGEKVKARAMSGSQICKIRLDDGRIIHWGSDYSHQYQEEHYSHLLNRNKQPHDKSNANDGTKLDTPRKLRKMRIDEIIRK